MHDGIDDAEFKALREILYLAALSRPAVANILGMHWVRDGVDGGEADIIDLVVGFNDPSNALSITELSWVQDGIEEVERQAIQQLTYLASTDANAAARVIVLPWVQDGIDIREANAVAEVDPSQSPTPTPSPVPTPTPPPSPLPTPPNLVSTYGTNNTRWLVRNYPALARQVQTLTWVQDGLSDPERSAFGIHDPEVRCWVSSHSADGQSVWESRPNIGGLGTLGVGPLSGDTRSFYVSDIISDSEAAMSVGVLASAVLTTLLISMRRRPFQFKRS